jgi:hypothetical protein
MYRVDGRQGKMVNYSILHFESMNEKSQETKYRLCSEERKRGKVSGIMKEVS